MLANSLTFCTKPLWWGADWASTTRQGAIETLSRGGWSLPIMYTDCMLELTLAKNTLLEPPLWIPRMIYMAVTRWSSRSGLFLFRFRPGVVQVQRRRTRLSEGHTEDHDGNVTQILSTASPKTVSRSLTYADLLQATTTDRPCQRQRRGHGPGNAGCENCSLQRLQRLAIGAAVLATAAASKIDSESFPAERALAEWLGSRPASLTPAAASRRLRIRRKKYNVECQESLTELPDVDQLYQAESFLHTKEMRLGTLRLVRPT